MTSPVYGWGCFYVGRKGVKSLWPITTTMEPTGTWYSDGWWSGPPTWMFWRAGTHNSMTQAEMLCETYPEYIVQEADHGFKTTALRPVTAITTPFWSTWPGLIVPVAEEIGFQIETFNPKNPILYGSQFLTSEVPAEVERLGLPRDTKRHWPNLVGT